MGGVDIPPTSQVGNLEGSFKQLIIKIIKIGNINKYFFSLIFKNIEDIKIKIYDINPRIPSSLKIRR